MTDLQKTLVLLVKKLVDNLNDESKEEEVKYQYSGEDFKGQDYVFNNTKDTYLGNFMVPIKDKNGNHAGWISWDSVSVKPDLGDDKWSVHEQMNISIGTKHNAKTYVGVALSEATKGYYDLNKPYKFFATGSEGKAHVTIKKTDSKRREITFKKLE
jgi:hypothetical protein